MQAVEVAERLDDVEALPGKLLPVLNQAQSRPLCLDEQRNRLGVAGVYAPMPLGLQWNLRGSGGMAEWTNATVLKTVNPHGFVGSNPTPSASSRCRDRLFVQVRLPQSTYLVDATSLT